MDFEVFYKQIDNDSKLKYLFDLLKTNTNLQKDFKSKVDLPQTVEKNVSKATEVDFDQLIELYHTNVLDHLDLIDISEIDWDDYESSGHYVEEWEIYQEMGETEIQNAFESIESTIMDLLIVHEHQQIAAYLIALGKACDGYELDDPNYIFDGNEREEFLAHYNKMIDMVLDKYTMIDISDNQIEEMLSDILTAAQKNLAQTAFTKAFEKYLLFLCKNATNQQHIYTIIEDSTNKFAYFPNIYNYLGAQFDQRENWLKFAKDNYQAEEQVAKDLLTYLRKTDKSEFEHIANILIHSNHIWNEFLIDLTDAELHTELFKTIHLNICKEKEAISYYQKVEHLLTDNEKDRFLTSINRKNLKMELLVYEKSFEQARKLLSEEDSVYTYHEIFMHLMEAQPEFCYSDLQKKMYYFVNNLRDRSNYKKMTEILQTAKRTPNHASKVNALIIEIYNYNKRLAALRDEFRIAKLVD